MDGLEIVTRRPLVTFDRHIAAPMGRYIDPDVNIFISTYNAASGVVLNVRGRILRSEDGTIVPFSFQHTPNTDRTEATTVEVLPEGFLLDVSIVVATGTVRRGQCYARLGLCYGTGVGRYRLAILAADYIGTGADVAYPGAIIQHPTYRPGILRVITGTNPAAGAEILETVPTGAQWNLISLQVALVTSATVANRNVTLTLDDGTSIFARSSAPITHAASLTKNYGFTQGMTLDTAGLSTVPTAGLAIPCILRAGYRIQTATASLQTGDDFGAPILYVEEVLEP